MGIELSKTLIDSLQPKATEYAVWDSRIVGFGIKITPKGKKIYLLKYRNQHQRQRKYTIGMHGQITLQQARQIAAQKMLEVHNDLDPMQERQKERTAITLSQFCDRYITDYAHVYKKHTSAIEDTKLINRHIRPKLGHYLLREVSRVEVAQFHKNLSHMPYGANRLRAVLSKMFSLAEEWGLREEGSNPTRYVKKYKESFRTRYLSQAELENLSDTLAAYQTKLKNPCHVTLIRLLLLTGARVSEIQNAKWEWIDFDKKLLILPDSKTGKRVIFLTKPVLAILKQMPRIAEHPYILFGRQFGQPIGVPNASWNLIREKAGLVDFRIHDLRHSYATICNQLELSEGTIGTLLGHRSKTTVTQRYTGLIIRMLR